MCKIIEKPIILKSFTVPISLDFIMNELRAFYKIYIPFKNQYLLGKGKNSRNKKTMINNIKIFAIIRYHLYGASNFKAFYELYASKIFRKLPKYSWFMRLRERAIIDLQCVITDVLLEEQGSKLITKRRKNMKPMKLNNLEKTLFRKRNIIETTCSQLWILNAPSILESYVIQPLKPHLRFSKNLLIRIGVNYCGSKVL